VSTATEVRVPDIGDFTDVPVIEILVAPGDAVAVDDPLVTLESDKATMEIPAPSAGVVTQLRVAIGDRVSEGSVLLLLDPDEAGPAEAAAATAPGDASPGPPAATLAPGDASPGPPAATLAPGAGSPGPPAATLAPGAGSPGPPAATPPAAAAAPPPPAPPRGEADHHAQLAVLGAGPGGYTAAFRAADLGLETILVERYPRLGGVCLNVGCIPSKTLLHAARVIAEAEEMAAHGISFGKPTVDLDALAAWKESVVAKLTGGLAGLARQRKVEVLTGVGRLAGPNLLTVGDETVSFEHCIIAAGAQAATLPGLPDDPRIVHSTGALDIAEIPKRMLVIGCGIIGLEMATVYDALGSKVSLVEVLDSLIPGCDPDLVRPLQKRIAARYEAIMLSTRVTGVTAQKRGLKVQFDDGHTDVFDRVLVAIGRRPNGALIGAEAAGVNVDERGFIPVDAQLRTNVPHIHAIGDIVGDPMLAHKASHEGKVAAEVIAGVGGGRILFDPRAIPSVAYTDPEIAWMGLTETEAKAGGVTVEKAVFPWAASGRALSLGRDEGMTKLLFEAGSRRLLGAGMVGVNAGELIAETVHAIELGADAEDLALTIHPHPTLSETVGFAAEMAEGTITDLMAPRRRR
jgi:dihydrolipoamide dehydrogenase